MRIRAVGVVSCLCAALVLSAMKSDAQAQNCGATPNVWVDGNSTLAIAVSSPPNTRLRLSRGGTLRIIENVDLVDDATIELTSRFAFDLETPGTGGVFEIRPGSHATLRGTICGDGSMTKTGAGALTLAATNTYTGPTSILDGTLSASAPFAISNSLVTVAAGASLEINAEQLISGLSGRGSVNLSDATLRIANGSDSTFIGTISGSGALAKSGAATLTLGAPNTYTGGTRVTDGVLEAGADGAFGAGDVFVGSEAVLNLAGFNQKIDALSGSGSIRLGSGTMTVGMNDATGVFHGTVVGDGALVKTGGGTLTLLGANSYGGGTTVEAGSVIGHSGSLQGNIINNGSVTFEQSFDGAYTGVMSGSGSLRKSGPGTLTLSGANGYTGGTIITEGTLLGSVISLRGTLMNDAQVGFTGNVSGTFDGILAGSGGFRKSGTGTLGLIGIHPHSGTFTVGDGVLALNGSLGSRVVVERGATFRALGNVLGTVNVHGSLVVPSSVDARGVAVEDALGPGDSLTGAPLFTIAGDLNVLPGSRLSLPLGSGPNPSVLVAGSATLNTAHLELTSVDPGPERVTSFNALTALGGLAVSNTTVATENSMLLPILRRDENSLIVTVLNLGAPLAAAAGGGNAGAIAAAVDASKAAATGDAAMIVRNLALLDDGELQRTLGTMAGESYATSVHLVARESEIVTDGLRDGLAVRQRERASSSAQGVRWWGDIGGERGQYDGVADLRDATMDLAVFIGGVDVERASWTFGAGGDFGTGSMSLDEVRAHTDLRVPRAFAYVGVQSAGLTWRAGGSFGRGSTRTSRRLEFSALLPAELGGTPEITVSRDARGREKWTIADQWGEFGGSVRLSPANLDWVAGLRHVSLDRSGLTESGAGALSLRVADQVRHLAQVDGRLRVSRQDGLLRPFAEFMLRRELTSTRTASAGGLVEFAESDFEIHGLPLARTGYRARFGSTLATAWGAIGLEYQLRHGTGRTSHSGGLRIQFN